MSDLNEIKSFILKNNSCYGCGLCAVVCPKDVIRIELSAEGFYIPSFCHETECVHCSLCRKVCSCMDEELSQIPLEIKGYIGYSNDDQTRNTCSSGGIAFEIAKQLFAKGYKACGVRYSCADNRAEHFTAITVNDFEKSKGSKYIQSYTVDGLKQINCKDKWVIFGSPCQIDSLRRWIKIKNAEDNIVLIDFFCHGVPSYHLWNSYLAFSKKKHGLQEIDEVNFRDKYGGNGWRSFAIRLKSGTTDIVSKLKDKDLFYTLFLGNYCLNKTCYDKCKFKNQQSSADIRIGDLWSKTNQQDYGQGVSSIFANTAIGIEILKELRASCTIKEESLHKVSEGQMIQRLKMPNIRPRVIEDLSTGKPLRYIYIYAVLLKKLLHLPTRIKNIMAKLLNKR